MKDRGRTGPRGPSRAIGALAALFLVGLGTACQEADFRVPSAAEVEERYEYSGDLTVEVSGNIAEVTIVQPATQLRRGGRLWAKVGPYVLLFSAPTRELFAEYGGLAGVRVATRSPGGNLVASALLRRESLNEITWKRALNVAGVARRDGTAKPTTLEDLVRYGEDNTEFAYNRRYVR